MARTDDWTIEDQTTLHRDDLGAVVLDLRTQQYFELNATGLVIWDSIAAGAGVAGARDALVARFDVAPAAAEAATVELLAALEAASLVRARGGSPGRGRLRRWLRDALRGSR